MFEPHHLIARHLVVTAVGPLRAANRVSERTAGYPRRRTVARVAVLALLVLLGFGAGPGGVEAARHAARGSGRVVLGVFNHSFAFEAQRARGRVTGRLELDIGFLEPSVVGGSVACLAVNGERAAFAGTLDEPLPNGNTHFVVVVGDNGSAEALVDTFTPAFALQPFGCAAALGRVGAERPLTSGNIRVR